MQIERFIDLKNLLGKKFKGLKALAEEGVYTDFFLVSQDGVATRQGNIQDIHWEDFLKRLWHGEIIAAG